MFSKPSKIFLSGICGTAMASLAGMLHGEGYSVAGSDASVYPPMSDLLASLGIPVADGFAEDNIRRFGPDLVVIGNALSRGNPEVEYVLESGLRYASMPETLKELFIRGRRSVVVTGTHGKTTSTAMLAWMLESAGRAPSFMLGGVAGNFSSSFRVGSGPEFVVEGDEYDTAFFDKGPKFLHYLPWIALVKNIEFDHADIYPDLESIEQSFRRLIRIVPRNGLIVAGTDSPPVASLIGDSPAPVATFGLDSGEWRAVGIHTEGGGTRFDVEVSGKAWSQFWIPMAGRFNVSNALGAIVAGDRIGLSSVQMRTALASFRGVRRRLEVRGEVAGVTVYDDFAHHPTAVGETLGGVRALFPEGRIWAVFEPRSQTSRRRLFEPQFAEALALADFAVVAPVYSPGHLDAADTLSPARLAGEVRRRGTEAYAPESVDEIVDLIVGHAAPGDRIVVMSNGAFENIHQRLIEALEQR